MPILVEVSLDGEKWTRYECEIAGANQRNAESGTTDCSTGRMPELCPENRAFQPAGNPDGENVQVELMAFIKMRCRRWEQLIEAYDGTQLFDFISEAKDEYRDMCRIIARQRGC